MSFKIIFLRYFVRCPYYSYLLVYHRTTVVLGGMTLLEIVRSYSLAKEIIKGTLFAHALFLFCCTCREVVILLSSERKLYVLLVDVISDGSG